MADDLDKLLQKARAENRKNGRPAPAPKKHALMPPATPDDDERYAVYRRLSPARISILEFALVAGAGISFGTIWLIGTGEPSWVWKGYDMFMVCTVICFGFLALRLVYTEIFALLTFGSFRKWRQRLPYRLEGWQELVDMPHFGKAHWWRRECIIRVDFGKTDTEATQAFRELSNALCRNCNKMYYTAFASDFRSKWSLNEFELKGSVNGPVARKIYNFLKRDMVLLAKRYGQPGKITIITRGGVDEVTPESSD